MNLKPASWWNRLRIWAASQKGAVIQECPPELMACEVCGHLDCRSEEWLNCRKRLAAAKFVQAGDMQALAELKQLQKDRDRAILDGRRACREVEQAQAGR